MRFVEKALEKMESNNKKFISIENISDIKGLAPIVKFTIQSDPIKEVGVNGCQAQDLLEYVTCLFESLNEAFSCNENEETIAHLKEAIFWQNERTRDRELRQVEGLNKI